MATDSVSEGAGDSPHTFHNEYNVLSQARDAMCDFMYTHHLSVANPEAVRFRHSGLQLTELNVSQIQYGTSVTVDLEPMEEYYSISLPIAGTQSLTHGDCTTHSDRYRGIVICPNQAVQLTMSGNCRKRLVRICRSALEHQLHKLLGTAVTDPVIFEPAMDAQQGQMASWWRMVKNLEREQKHSVSLFVDGPILAHVEEMLVAGLLYGQRHNYTEELAKVTTITVPIYVRRAQSYIREHARHNLTIESIVAAAGIPKRRLYEGFKRCCGIAPMQYLREVRMTGVRGELLGSRCDDDITTVALRWGFSHLGRFTREYKKRFGELPSATRARCR
ncbi:AraC family transcriptional regulator [Exilibacterium tricleocarpae]|uniref:AraC family transcriptional regulator n=1 Tax=Exilibacterium tricleocarpae TaxID=2591008 RepID=A0A545T675_9GAMM|nr:AraC family transcriptional regulator [Exilibacterium tricleocarpae]TQV72730.1 AraC family transcriptional regulator [Exilibacterium tricleocarpae]